MKKIKIDRKNYDKFIFAGSLALECYNDDNNKYENLYIEFIQKLREYRKLLENIEEKKEYLVNELILTMEKMGVENFTLYDDGGVEYNYNSKKEENDQKN